MAKTTTNPRRKRATSANQMEAARDRIAKEISDLRDLQVGPEALDAIQKAVASLDAAVQTMHDALFGYWDKERLSDVPGFQTRLRNIENFNLWLKRAALYVVGPMLTFIFLHTLGVPTDTIGHSVANGFWSYLSSHTAP
jgi:hypothetical protein